MHDSEKQAAAPRSFKPPVSLPVETQPRGIPQILWDRRWTVVIMLAIGLAAGGAYLAVATPLYTSTSQLYVEQTGPKIITEYQGVMTQSKNYVYNQEQMIKSAPILSSALERPGIRRLKAFEGVENPVQYLKDHLDTSVGKKDDIITVGFSSPFREDAAQVVNAVVDAYITYTSAQKRSTLTEVLRLLQKERAKRDAEADASFKALKDYEKEHPEVSLETQKGNVVVQRLLKLSDVLTEAEVDTFQAKANYETAEAMMSEPARAGQLAEALRAKGQPSPMSSESDRLQGELQELELRLVALKQQGTDEHPAVQTVKARIGAVRKQLADLNAAFAKSEVALLKQTYEAARKKESDLRKQFDDQRQATIDLTSQIADYTFLTLHWERVRKLSEILDDRIREINVAEEAGPLNITVVEVGRPEDGPSSPKPFQVMAMALVIGLMLGCTLAFVQEGVDQRIRSSDAVAAALGLPVLGSLPIIPAKEDSLRTRALNMHLEPKSHAAEAIRTIRTAIYFGVPSSAPAKTMLITSPEAGEGKSVIVSNLAIAIAQAGHRVLVVDGDFRKPKQDKIFEVIRAGRLYDMMKERIAGVLQRLDSIPGEKKEPSASDLLTSNAFDKMLSDMAAKYDRKIREPEGLSSVLAGRTTLAAAVLRTTIDGLDLLPCGTIPPNPSELLNSEALAAMLKEVSTQYDHIIFDAPPVLPVTDARILGAMCNMTILVLRAEVTSIKRAQLARDALRSVGAHILGVVVNAVPRRKDKYYDGGYLYSEQYTNQPRTEAEGARESSREGQHEGDT